MTLADADQQLLRELCEQHGMSPNSLEKAGVSMPDVLRAEKTPLAAALSTHADATQALSQIVDEIGDILSALRNRFGFDHEMRLGKGVGVRCHKHGPYHSAAARSHTLILALS